MSTGRGVVTARVLRRQKTRWTAYEIDLLHREYGEVSLRSLREKLGRSARAIRNKVQEVGLTSRDRRGVPAGYELLRHAAKRTGFCERYLLTLLRDAEVVVRRGYAWRARKNHRTWYAEPDEIDRAVHHALQHEAVNTAARRLHRATLTLRRLAQEAGHLVRPRRPFRLLPEAWDALTASDKGCRSTP